MSAFRFGSKAASQFNPDSSTRAAAFGVYRTLATQPQWLLSARSGRPLNCAIRQADLPTLIRSLTVYIRDSDMSVHRG